MLHKKIEELTPNQCLQAYLMASYLYYIRFTSVIEDTEYDKLAKRLLKDFDKVEHQHKYLVTEDDLRAGTLYSLKDSDYPTMIRMASEMWAREHFQETET